MPTALPKTDSPQVQCIVDEDANYLSTYDLCLKYEQEVATDANRLRYLRILGFLLLNAPNRDVRSEAAKCIDSHKEDGRLVELGAFFERYLILPFIKPRDRTPKSSYPSWPFVVKNQAKVDITVAPRSHKDAKDRALIRDNWRCVVTGVVHNRAPDDIIANLAPEAIVSNTECAHIIPEATFFGVNSIFEENHEFDHSASVLAVLKQFRYDISSFNGEKVHSPSNVITMGMDVHDMFDRLLVYFEATSQNNHYEVKRFSRLLPHPHMRPFVTFSTPDPIHLPVPAPGLLALHATCCKVAHLSGAAEYIRKIYRDAEEMDVLAHDGTSGDILSYALLSSLNYEASVRR